MATGIVSVAAALQRLPIVSDALFALAAAAWIALSAAVSARALRDPRPRPRLQSFALVAATAVLGARVLLFEQHALALALWSLAAVLWLALLLRRPRIAPTSGASLLVVVATESLAALAAQLARLNGEALLLPALAAWALGLLLYPFVVATIAKALRNRPRFTPDLWILMGALAIATLSGAELLPATRELHGLAAFRSWLHDVDLGTWAAASAWIAPLFALELRARGWAYTRARWSFVFPLGMYSAASETLGRAAAFPALTDVSRCFFFAALGAWSVVLLAHSLGSGRGGPILGLLPSSVTSLSDRRRRVSHE